MDKNKTEIFSSCCSCPSSSVEIVDGVGICADCGEWCSFIECDEEGNEILKGIEDGNTNN